MQLEVYESLSYGEAEPLPASPAAEPSASEIPKLDASIALWLILFVLGGGLLALYYSGIHYFPEVSWQDALTFMALMTIIGGSLLIAYGFLLLVPGVIWSEFLICDQHLRYVLMMRHRRLEPCVWSITKRILFPFALFMAFCHFLLFQSQGSFTASTSPGGATALITLGAAASLLAVTALLLKNLRTGLAQIGASRLAGSLPLPDLKPDPRSMNRYRLLVTACHFPMLCVFVTKSVFHYVPLYELSLWIMALLPLWSFAVLFRYRKTEKPLWDTDHFSLLCRAALAFDSAAFLSFTALWFFHRIYGGEPSGTKGISPGLLVLCTVVVIVTNLLVAMLFHKHRRQAFFAGFLAALLLLGAGQLLKEDAANTLPAKIMQRYGFGGQTVRLVVTERGGRLLCQQRIPVQFEAQTQQALLVPRTSGTNANPPGAGQDKPQKEERLAFADNLTILSRLGSQFLLQVDNDRMIVFPKGEVISWSTLSKAKSDEFRFRSDCKMGGLGRWRVRAVRLDSSATSSYRRDAR